MPCNLILAGVCMAVNYDLGARRCKAVQVNFDLAYTTAACPHKHDLSLSIPNEFVVLPPDTMVVAVFRWGLCCPDVMRTAPFSPVSSSNDTLLGAWHDCSIQKHDYVLTCGQLASDLLHIETVTA